MATSPSTDNYYVGKGIVAFQATGESAARDLGNVETFELSMSVEKLDHFSSRAGVRSKDKSSVVEKGGTVRLVMDEITAENLALALGGTIAVNSATQKVITILGQNSVEGVLTFTGANEIGNKLNVELLNVSFAPGGTISLISDEWGQLEIEGEVLVDGSGDFGTITEIPQA